MFGSIFVVKGISKPEGEPVFDGETESKTVAEVGV